jgi:hypothetical protein
LSTVASGDAESEARARDLTLRALLCEEAAGAAIPASFGWKAL